ncbi:MAG: exopolysaccharide biosynthesis polyprenyl glycosylphosphotransferase [Bacteroidota bacterium]|nr:exopolysaccharide biosynthesis polyprenyl glycosylphosphotransferase [Bacteroidota bacterium]
MLKRNWKIAFVIISQLIDVLAIWAGGFVIFSLKWSETIHYITPDENLLIGFTFFTAIYLLIASMLGLYRGSFHLSLRLQNLITARAFVITVLISLAVNSFAQAFVGKNSVITFVLSLAVLLLVARFFLKLINLYFQRLGYGVHNSLIVGVDKDAEKLFYRFSTFPELGYKTKGFIVKEKGLDPTDLPQYTQEDITHVVATKNIDRIFIPSTEFSLNGYSYLKSISHKSNVKLKIISPHAEDLLKISRIYDIAGITISAPIRSRVKILKSISKRTFDIIASSIIILLLSPIFLITIVANYLESGRPIFFMQRRGAMKGGYEFDFIKFRSMVTNAEQIKQELMDKNESDGALFKMKNDPRVTRVGKIIRKLSIDELPQLFNVLKGDMSLVGPRPLPLKDFERATESDEFWDAIKERGSVKPGMTGLWQISGRSEIKFRDMILLDLYYVENQSLLFDLEILFETIPVVAFGRGAY